MRIAILSKADSTGGGASRVAEDLYRHLPDAGHHVVHWCSFADKYGERREHLWGGRRYRNLAWLGYGVSKYAGMGESIPLEIWPLSQARLWDNFDIVHVHDTTMAISPFTLDFLSRRMPVLWTMHDCSPFTGGCLYPMGCEKYKSSCGSCPERGAWPLTGALDNTSLFLKEKRWLHKSGRVALCAPSRWMAGMAVSSGNVKRPVDLVPNCVDTDLFRPLDTDEKRAIRRLFGVPEGKTVVLMSSWSLADKRKGGEEAATAVDAVKDLDPYFVLVGNPSPALREKIAPMGFVETDMIKDRRLLALWYALSDIYLFPSRADNQPLSVLEAMSCGLGTVAFRAAGVAEMIEPGLDGMLVPDGDACALGAALRHAIATGEFENWKVPARERMLRDHAIPVFVRNHEDIYARTIEEWKAFR